MSRYLLRVLAAAALGVSSYVHLHLASQFPFPGTISGTQVFQVQGAVTAALAVALLLTGNRWVWLAAAAVALASFAAVMTYRYVDLGAIGPLPDMYDTTWNPSPDKLLSAVVEAAVPVLALLHFGLVRRQRGRTANGSRSGRTDAPAANVIHSARR